MTQSTIRIQRRGMFQYIHYIRLNGLSFTVELKVLQDLDRCSVSTSVQAEKFGGKRHRSMKGNLSFRNGHQSHLDNEIEYLLWARMFKYFTGIIQEYYLCFQMMELWLREVICPSYLPGQKMVKQHLGFSGLAQESIYVSLRSQLPSSRRYVQ